MEASIKLKAYKHVTTAIKLFHSQNMGECQKFGETFESFCEYLHDILANEPKHSNLPFIARAMALHLCVHLIPTFGFTDGEHGEIVELYRDYFSNKYYLETVNN